MKYLELINLCQNCNGCNLLEMPYFRGKEKCENYSKANDTGLEKCWKILKAGQISYKQIKFF